MYFSNILQNFKTGSGVHNSCILATQGVACTLAFCSHRKWCAQWLHFVYTGSGMHNSIFPHRKWCAQWLHFVHTGSGMHNSISSTQEVGCTMAAFCSHRNSHLQSLHTYQIGKQLTMVWHATSQVHFNYPTIISFHFFFTPKRAYYTIIQYLGKYGSYQCRM